MRSAFRGQLVFAACLLCGAALLTERSASAQCEPQRQIMELNRQGMEAYSNLEIDVALQSLQQAAQLIIPCVPMGVQARTWANLGVVHVGGMMANAEGIDAFRTALCLDQSIQLDPLTSTPDIQTTFRLAQVQNQQQGCPAGVGEPTPPPTQPPPTQPPPTQPPPTQPPPTQPPPQAFELYRMIPVLEQQRMHPLPVYIEVNPAVQVGEVTLNYRVAGESQFTRLPMESMGSNAFGVTIPCETITLFDPSWIEYYMQLSAPDGRVIGTAPNQGSEQPYRANMVETLTGERPSIGGRPPPAQCVNCGDIPPGAPIPPECQRGCASGFTCDVDDDCPGGGQSCTNGCCSGGGDDGGGRNRDGGFRPYAYVQALVGWGGGLVLATDNVTWDESSAAVPNNALLRLDDSGDCPSPNLPPSGEDSLDDTARGGSLSNWGVQSCWHRTQAAGFGYGPGHFRLNAGGYIIPRLSVGLTFRMQFSGFQSDSHMLWALGVRARYHILQQDNMELSVGLQVQIYGMMQVFLNLASRSSGEVQSRAWAVGGYEAVGLTISYAYYFIRQVGVYVELTSDWTLPDFIWNIELSTGPAFRF